MTETWWAISGDDLLSMLRRVAQGEDPDNVLIEAYVNSEIEPVDEDD